ncbi:hypothetical protein HDU79_002107 [Rhizoclosmatium sp. JEL0117]|nr:hypothetical protein HDU79_002107 [Rhizoclosmatium sp. JEL0117]
MKWFLAIAAAAAQLAAAHSHALTSALLEHRRDMANTLSTCAIESGIHSRDGTAGAAILTPEVEEGPFWIAREMIRQDIVDGQQGIPMTLQLRVVSVADCKPIANAFVEVWHVNAVGEYSGYIAESSTQGNPAADLAIAQAAGVPVPDMTPEEQAAYANEGAYSHAQLGDNLNFCRGAYKTDANGYVTFTSIVPSYYTGRPTHIHNRVYLDGVINSDGSYNGINGVHIGQLFFDEAIKSQLYTIPPYSVEPYIYTANEEDGDFLQETQTSSDSIVRVSKTGANWTDGIFAAAVLVVDPNFRVDELPQVPNLVARPNAKSSTIDTVSGQAATNDTSSVGTNGVSANSASGSALKAPSSDSTSSSGMSPTTIGLAAGVPAVLIIAIAAVWASKRKSGNANSGGKDAVDQEEAQDVEENRSQSRQYSASKQEFYSDNLPRLALQPQFVLPQQQYLVPDQVIVDQQQREVEYVSRQNSLKSQVSRQQSQRSQVQQPQFVLPQQQYLVADPAVVDMHQREVEYVSRQNSQRSQVQQQYVQQQAEQQQYSQQQFEQQQYEQQQYEQQLYEQQQYEQQLYEQQQYEQQVLAEQQQEQQASVPVALQYTAQPPITFTELPTLPATFNAPISQAEIIMTESELPTTLPDPIPEYIPEPATQAPDALSTVVDAYTPPAEEVSLPSVGYLGFSLETNALFGDSVFLGAGGGGLALDEPTFDTASYYGGDDDDEAVFEVVEEEDGVESMVGEVEGVVGVEGIVQGYEGKEEVEEVVVLED